MAFLDDIGKKISQTGQDAAKKAKDLAETTKLNLIIDEQKKVINSLYLQLGAKYYAVKGTCPDEELIQLCSDINASMNTIAAFQGEIEKIAASEANSAVVVQGPIKNCPSCGGANATDAAFCHLCGSKLESPEPVPGTFCLNCGQPLKPNAAFCGSCGNKVG